MKQMVEDPWLNDIPDRYQVGHLIEGEVTKITNFGVFVRLEPELEGLLHISELADHKVTSPEDVIKVGEKLVVKIIRVDSDDRKIGLSLKEVIVVTIQTYTKSVICVAGTLVLALTGVATLMSVGVDARIKAALPTIESALTQGARVLVMSHLGRPSEGKFDSEMSLAPVAEHLGDQLRRPLESLDLEPLQGRAAVRRGFEAQGHEVRLMSPEYVRPYVKSHKNDDRDAAAALGVQESWAPMPSLPL